MTLSFDQSTKISILISVLEDSYKCNGLFMHIHGPDAYLGSFYIL